MKTYRPSTAPCPIGRASRVLGDRWAMLVMREALLGVDRFADFLERLPISRAALSSRLALLCDAGLLERHPPEEKRARYRLTEAGEGLRPVFLSIGEWASAHLFEPGAAPDPARRHGETDR